MTKKPDLTQQPPPIITIVGGGFTGSTIAIQQACYYISLFKENKILLPLTIRLIDEKGSFGPGLPYSTHDDVFLLNQPAYAMSPFPEEPDHYTKWLGGDKNAFATRQQYGEYLKETLFKTFNDATAAGIPLKLETLTDEITDLTLEEGRIILSRKDDAPLKTDTLVLATGHQRGLFLNALSKSDRYFAGTYSVADVEHALKDAPANDSVVIVGTGQSMIDALAVLDHIGYKGKIYAFSSSLVAPWPFDPTLYKKSLHPYVPRYLDPARVSKAKDQSFRALKKRLYREFKRAESLGYGIGHVLGAIDFKGLSTAGPGGAPPEGLKDLQDLWERIYGNPTPPERYALLERYKKSGQLVLVRKEVQAGNITVEKDGFTARGLVGKKPLHLSAVFNAAAFNRKSLASPLLQKAADKNILRLQGNVIAPGQQNPPTVFAAGPPTGANKWGVETFRDNNASVAKKSVTVALGLTT